MFNLWFKLLPANDKQISDTQKAEIKETFD